MKSIRMDMTFSLIQEIRLIHALAESDFLINVPEKEAYKFLRLNEKFGLQLGCSNEGYHSKNLLKVSHPEPLTSIGSLSRPLIFPHVLTEYCHSLWSTKRKYRYSFVGLITPKRKCLMNNWIKENITPRDVNVSYQGSLRFKIRQKLYSLVGLDDTQKIQAGDLLLWFSMKGRRFPIKAWDEEYFNILGNSQYVLCPSGDCDWSYRFFEAILCGAMPIVEKNCPCYEGFRFISFEDKVKTLSWSKEDADYNYRLCCERITLPKIALNNELNRLMGF